ncbi:MAG TPA: transglycosylase domain-containing protein [Clostridia bacterium]|nr:transglycosylase domain-containing protein [Clostridia bacterium]
MDKIKKWLGSFLKPKPKSNRPTKQSAENNNKQDKRNHPIRGLFVRKRRQPNFFLSVFVTTLRLFLILFILVGFVGFGAVVGIGKAYLDSTPELDVVQIQEQSETTFIYDKYGNLITEYYGYENRIWAAIDEIPETLRKAFIAIEDTRFDVHNGIDIKRIFGSIIHNLSNESVQGASTLTQQLLKNTILTPEVSYKRKIQEMYLAIQLEKRYSKDQIMEAYLNTIWLGGSNYGVKAAAKDYFGKELNELSLRECAMLAGITQNPWQYDPRANTYIRDNPEPTYKRTNLVIDRMYENTFISESEYQRARIDESEYYSKPVHIEENPTSNDYPMKYFIEYVIKDVRDRIMVLEGWEGEEGRRKAEQYIYSGGLHIYTTVDPNIQQVVEESVYNYKNLPKFQNSANKFSKQGVEQPQAAAVVIDQHTGELQAIVGGKQPPTGKRQYNRAFHPDAKLPLGSSIKPLSVYGPFIEAGYPGGIIIENIPAAIDGWKGGERPYPRNYGDSRYDGPTDVHRGIFKSLNVVAARIILERIGPQYSADKLKELGFDSKDVSEEPAALSLGTRGNNMIEVAGAYAAIANKGIYQEPISFTRIVDKHGKEIINIRKDQVTRVVFKESTAFILTDWMQDVVDGGTATVRIKNGNGKRIKAAGKTGTNSDFKGVFFAGFTPYYTSTVWLGHDDFQPRFVKNTTGGKFAAPLWETIMNSIHVDLEGKEFYDRVPDDVVRFTVCGVSGKRPNGELCGEDISGHKLVTEWFPKNAIPGHDEICDMHVQIEACPYSGKPPTPYCPADHKTKASAILLPKNSPYRKLSDKDLAKYLPGAVKDTKRLANLDYNNPNDRPFFCPLHTEEWYKGELERESMTGKASALIAQVKSNMANPKYIPKLTEKRLDKLHKAIAKLEGALKQGVIDKPEKPNKDKGHIKELPIFDADLVEKEMENLEKISKEIFAAVEKELEKDKPKPDPVIPDPPEGGDEEPPADNGGENNEGE